MSPSHLHEISEAFSRADLQRMWVELNACYFENRLPPIQILWSSRLTSTAGIFVSQNGPRQRWVGREERHGTGRVIRLSLPLHRAQGPSILRSTLAHEMIHQWQFDVKKCRPSHGPEFRRLMILMNRDGLGVSVYHSLHKEKEIPPRYAWQCRQCGQSYTRQRKSLSTQRHRCGECQGKLREMSPFTFPQKTAETGVPRVEKTVEVSGFTNVPVQLSFPFVSIT